MSDRVIQIVDYVAANSIRYPVVLGRKNGGQLEVLLKAEDLTNCAGDHSKFLDLLRTKAVEKDVPLAEGASSKSS